jgi:hypothetical protein
MKPVDFSLREYGPFKILTWEVDPNHDSLWAVHAGSDGNIYFSSCSEGRASSAHLLRFGVREGRLWDLLDIGELSHDPYDSGRVPQSKIHTCLRESADGYLYGVSHCTAPNFGEKLFEVNGTFGDPVFGFRGSQMFRVKMATGETEYLGVAVPFEGCRSMEIIERLNKAYLVSYPRHCLYEYDLGARKPRLIARIGTWGGFEVFSDSRERLWGTYDDGRFYRYYPEEDKFEDLKLRVPGIPGREKLYNFFFFARKFRPDFICATGYYDGHIFRINPEQEDQGAIEDYGSGWPGGWNGKDWTPPYVQAPVLYKNRWLFYGCNTIWEPTRLVVCDIETNHKKPLAVLDFGGNPTAWLSEGTLGPDGETLFFAEVNMKAVPRLVIVDAGKFIKTGG